MVVDHVESDGEAAGMSRVHQTTERRGTAVGILGSKKVDTIVAPVSRAGKLRDGHQFDRGDAEMNQLL